MATLSDNGYLEGRLNCLALWFEPSKGGEGRIAAIVKHDKKYYVADVTCDWKFWSGSRDSLRTNWVLSENTRKEIRKAMTKRLKKTPNAKELRDIERDLLKNTDDALAQYLASVAGKKNISAYKIFSKPHGCYWHADIGYADARLKLKPNCFTHEEIDARSLFPVKENVPAEVLKLMQSVGALWPEDHVTLVVNTEIEQKERAEYARLKKKFEMQ